MELYTITTATASDNTDKEIWATNIDVFFTNFDAACIKAEDLLMQSFLSDEAKRDAKRDTIFGDCYKITARSEGERHIIKVQKVRNVEKFIG